MYSKDQQPLDGLTDLQRNELETHIRTATPLKYLIQQIEQRLVDSPECPHCHSTLINRHGKTGDTQRYRCKNCLKTFVATTNTPMARLRHKEKWDQYFHCMTDSLVLRESAKRCEINLKTSFRWRHRFLQLPALLQPKRLEGIIEADETFFAYSEKGSRSLSRKPRKRGSTASKRGRSKDDWVPVLTVRDRGEHTLEAILEGTSSEQIGQSMNGLVVKDSILCTDGYGAYIQIAKDNDLEHKRLNLSAGIRCIDKVFHIQNVNAYHSRLKSWMTHFHGVATKYLAHYLGWFRLMDAEEESLSGDKWFRLQQQLTGT